MIKKANIQWTAKQLVKMINKGTINFDNSVQRGYVWNDKRKSLLIHSMITGYPVPAFYASKNNNGYDMLDGKQRSSAISEFMNNKFLLVDVPEIEVETNDGTQFIDVNGLDFDKLSEDVQDTIASYSLTIYYFDGITDDEITEMFFRLNNGKPLTSIELTRVKAKSIEKIKEIGKHPIFTNALTEKALNRYTNEDIVIKSWAILNMEYPSFETKSIRPLIETADITEQQSTDINMAFTRLVEVYNIIKTKPYKSAAEKKLFDRIAKRILTRTHLITLVPIALDSVKNGISEQQMSEWVLKFFIGTKSATIDDTYNANASSGSAKPESIKARLSVAMNSYKQFVKTENNN